MLTYTLYGPPRTKKNHQRILRGAGGRPTIAQSKEYVQYERDCLWQLHPPSRPLAGPVNVRCLYYMPTRRRVDLVNLIEATCDILVKAGVLADDCAAVMLLDAEVFLTEGSEENLKLTTPSDVYAAEAILAERGED